MIITASSHFKYYTDTETKERKRLQRARTSSASLYMLEAVLKEMDRSVGALSGMQE